MHCSECGAQVNETVRFCPQCGSPLSLEKNAVLCLHCGTTVQDTARFCPHCGRVLSSEKYDEYLHARAEDLERKIAEDAGDIRSCLQLGQLYKRLGLHDKAEEKLQTVLAHEPRSDFAFDAYYLLGRMLSEDFDNSDSLERAIRLLNAAIELKPETEEAKKLETAVERIEYRIDTLKG